MEIQPLKRLEKHLRTRIYGRATEIALFRDTERSVDIVISPSKNPQNICRMAIVHQSQYKSMRWSAYQRGRPIIRRSALYDLK